MASRDSLKPKKQSSKDSLSPARAKAIGEYRKQRRRVQQATRRQRAKGLNVKINIPKLNLKEAKTSTIKKTTTQLKKITPAKIRETAEVQQEEVETKSPYEPSNEQGFDKQQAKADQANKERMDTDGEYADQFKIGQITYRKMLDMIDDSKKSDKYWGWKYLENLFNTEINDYNFESVMKSIANFDQSEVLKSAETACYASSQTEVMSNISWLAMVIKGTVLSAQEAKEIGDVTDKDDTYTSPSD